MKVLVVSSNAFSKVLNNGKTYEAIFSDFKPSEIIQLFTRPQDSALSDFDFSSSYYTVSEMDIINKLLMRSSDCGGTLNRVMNQKQQNIYEIFSNRRIKNYSFLRELLWGTNLWKNKTLNRWIESEKPDVIFMVGGSRHLFSITKYIKEKLEIPFVVFFTDDYVIYPLKKGAFKKWRKNAEIKRYRQIITESSLCFCIGEKMSVAYSDSFGKTFYPIMNSIAIEKYLWKQIDLNKIIISYFGGLHLDRWKMILRLGNLVPANCELRVYTASKMSTDIQEKFASSKVKVMGCVTDQELKKAMYESDMFLHVESDDIENRALTRLSVSTKIPEYLMRGRAVIGFGPQEVASMRLLVDNEIGFFLNSENSDTELQRKIMHFVNNPVLIDAYSKKGYSYAIENFDKEKNAKKFRSEIEKLIQN